MMHVLPFDVVELAQCPAIRHEPCAALREVAFRQNAWLPDDDAKLRAGFVADDDLLAIADRLGRTLDAVRSRIDALGLRRNSHRPWSELEDADLARDYGQIATSSIALTHGRSPGAVYARAGLLGLTEGTAPAYTAWEIAQISAGYAQGVPVAQLGVLIGRPVCGIASVASRLAIRHANASPDWSDAEALRALELADAGFRYVIIAERLAAEAFPRRTGRTVGQTLRRLGYGRGWGRPWFQEEDDLLRHAYATGRSLTPLLCRLGRTTQSLRWRAKELSLQGTHERPNGWRVDPVWTKADIAALRRDYGQVPTRTLAASLNRKKSGIYNKAFSLGLVHGWMRAFSADEDRAIGIARAGTISLPDLSAALGRDTAVVGKHAAKLGIPFATRPHPVPRGPRGTRAPLTLDGILALGASLQRADQFTSTQSDTQESPMPRRTVAARPDPVEDAIRTAGSIGALERLAGIGQTQDEHFAFWRTFTALPASESINAGVAELKRLIRSRHAPVPDAGARRARS